ncbi:polysaccharide biosynthesis tyrosine autokinase [Microbacterium sp. KR10-403]|uniref:polysaccharide biosynthesis tyrosine autokinase n=1 Tax=Microbacterium sp. KR10-403 TaxID=3158581 RepID=UPI0032E4F194
MDVKPQVAPSRIIGRLIRGWWILLATAFVGAVLSFGYSSLQTPIFESTASSYFSMRSATSGSDINQGSAYTQNQMLSFAQLAMSSMVLDEVREQLDVNLTNSQIRSMTSVAIPQDTVTLDVTAASSDRQFAADMANSISKSLSKAVDVVAPKDDAGNATVVARVIQPAEPAIYQSSPNKQRDALLGAFAGLLIAGLAITAWALLDTRVRNEEVLRRVTDLPVLGSVPTSKSRGGVPTMVAETNGPNAEAYRSVRSSLVFAAVGHDINAIAVTSSIPGEGKTTTAVNLALTYAEAGASVLLVDADLRRPMVASSLGLENAVGLTTMLVGAANFEEARLQWGDSRVFVLPAGEIPPNPAELLASRKMRELLTELRSEYDIMIVDTAPLMSVSDATIITPLMDTTVIVAEAYRVQEAQLARSLSALAAVRAQVAGVLLNKIRRPRRSYSNYYYAPNRDGERESREAMRKHRRGYAGDRRRG